MYSALISRNCAACSLKFLPVLVHATFRRYDLLFCVDNFTGRWRRNAWPAHKVSTKFFCGPSSTQPIKCWHCSGPSHYLLFYRSTSPCPAPRLPTSARASATTSAISPAFARQQVGNLTKFLRSYFPLSLVLNKKPRDTMGLRHLLSRIDTGRLPSSPRTPSSPY